MRFSISVGLAFLVSGMAQTIRDLQSDPLVAPQWTYRPTLGMAVFVILSWFTRPILQNIASTHQKGRGLAFGLLGVLVQMSMLTGFIWLCITGATLLFRPWILQAIGTLVFVVIGSLFVLPLAAAVMMPLTLILSFPLDLLFPLKGITDARTIACCLNCKHYRRLGDWGDLLHGTWQSLTMPQSEKLPCNIALETSEVWRRYFSREPKSRPSFPSDCPFFERRA